MGCRQLIHAEEVRGSGGVDSPLRHYPSKGRCINDLAGFLDQSVQRVLRPNSFLLQIKNFTLGVRVPLSAPLSVFNGEKDFFSLRISKTVSFEPLDFTIQPAASVSSIPLESYLKSVELLRSFQSRSDANICIVCFSAAL